MIKHITILTFLLLSLLGSSQSKKIDSKIKELNNSQFIIDHSDKALFSVKSSAAKKLIKTGKPALPQLIEALNDTARVIMVQYVLCEIWFNNVSFAGPKMAHGSQGHVYKYYLGEEHGEGLIVSESKENNKYRLFVEPKDIEKIKEYWKKKTAK